MTNLTNSFRHYDILGFDKMLNQIDRMFSDSWKRESYPPINIYSDDDVTTVIEVAVAGFTEEQLSVTKEDNLLVIEGKHLPYNPDNFKDTAPDLRRQFSRKDIAARWFKRSFVLADTIEVASAKLEYGMLTITLKDITVKKRKAVEIPIQSDKQLLMESKK